MSNSQLVRVRAIGMVAVTISVLGACGGGVAVLTRPVVSATPSSLDFGNTTPQNTVISESSVSGATFTSATTTCSGIATISTTDNKTFTVTPHSPLVAGNCSFTFSAGDGMTGIVKVAVTTTTVGVSAKERK